MKTVIFLQILNLFTAILLEAFNVDSLKGKENSNKNSNAIKQVIAVFFLFYNDVFFILFKLSVVNIH